MLTGLVWLSGQCKATAIPGGYKWDLNNIVAFQNNTTEARPGMKIVGQFAGGSGTVAVKQGATTIRTGTLTGSPHGQGGNFDVAWDDNTQGTFGVTSSGRSGNAEVTI